MRKFRDDIDAEMCPFGIRNGNAAVQEIGKILYFHAGISAFAVIEHFKFAVES